MAVTVSVRIEKRRMVLFIWGLHVTELRPWSAELEDNTHRIKNTGLGMHIGPEFLLGTTHTVHMLLRYDMDGIGIM
jgi:hypothetical protein